jgi:hypothetical protein
MVDLFNPMAAASISFETHLDGWVRLFNLELWHTSGSNAEEAWGLFSEMMFAIIKELCTAKRPGSVAESELEPTNQCALVLWGCLHPSGHREEAGGIQAKQKVRCLCLSGISDTNDRRGVGGQKNNMGIWYWRSRSVSRKKDPECQIHHSGRHIPMVDWLCPKVGSKHRECNTR